MQKFFKIALLCVFLAPALWASNHINEFDQMALRLQPNNISHFHLPPHVMELRVLLDKIATATGNPAVFIAHHAEEMLHVPRSTLQEGLKEGWFEGTLHHGSFYMNLLQPWQGICSTLAIQQRGMVFLPDALWTYTHLRCLHLPGNHLIFLSHKIGALTGLTDLNLNDNHLTSVPDTIGNLTKATMIELAGNPCTTLPKTFVNLTCLKYLRLSPAQHQNPQTASVVGALQTAQKALDLNPVCVLCVGYAYWGDGEITDMIGRPVSNPKGCDLL